MASVGDIGAQITVTIYDSGAAKDISGATSANLIAKAPSGEVKTFAASIVGDGTTGQIRYTTTSSDDLDETGQWEAEADVLGPSSVRFRTDEPVRFYVHRNL